MSESMTVPTPRKLSAARQVALLAINDARLTVKDRAAFIWMLLLPVALMWLFGQSDTGGAPPKIALAVEDRDGGWLARALIDDLADDDVNLRELGEADADADPASDDGPPPRRLVVPAGTTAAAVSGDQRELRLEIDSDANATFSAGAEVHVRRALVRVLGRLFEMETSAEGIPETDAAAAERFAELAARQPRVALAVETAGAGRPVPSGFAQSVPGILTMIVLMMTLIYGGVFLVYEKEEGMLRRQLTVPLSRRRLIAGKILGRLLIAALQIAVLLLIARGLFSLDLGRSPFGLLLLTGSFAVAVAGLATLLGAVARSVDQASTVGWIGSMVLAGLGGCWWPAEVMPEWLRTAALAFPTSWAMEGFHGLISFGGGVDAVVLPSVVLLGFGLVFGIAGARLLRVG